MREPGVIDACISMFIEKELDLVITMLEIPHEHNPYWAFLENEEGLLQLSTGGYEPIPRRQMLPPAYHREGSVYVSRAKNILDHNTLYGTRIGGYLLKQATPINIDTLADWAKAEEYMSKL
jgi:CMP-N-acetylneuraminic acid synthetase